MKTYRVSGHFTVGPRELTGEAREEMVRKVEEVLREGLSACTTIKGFVVARQMRPPNPNKLEPDLCEEVTIEGEDREAVFTTYRNDPSHLGMVKVLAALYGVTWTVVVYELPEKSQPKLKERGLWVEDSVKDSFE